MLSKIVEDYADLPWFLRRTMWRAWHNIIIASERQVDITLLNYGYMDLDDQTTPLCLEPEDELQRYCINLYHRTGTHIDLAGKDVLEVGSGRGGGASYIARYLGPRTMVGVDLSAHVIAFCNQHHAPVKNLKFVKGDAEDLPFPAAWFDAVVNVESSRCYPHMDRFLAEVHRVLRSGGSLLLTDLRWRKDVPTLRQQVLDAGFSIKTEVDISANVVRALEVDNPRRKEMIRAKVPAWMVASFDEFAGVEGSGRHQSFVDGSMQYWTLHACKDNLEEHAYE